MNIFTGNPKDQWPFHASLTSLILIGISAMLDSGKHDGISFDQVKQHANAGDLVDFLNQEAGEYFAWNSLDEYPVFKAWYVGRVAGMLVAFEGREHRKYGVQRSGLCLLLSVTAELIAQPSALSAIETGCGRSRVIIVENSLCLLGDEYQRAAVVFDGDPDTGTPARWVCQESEGRDEFIARVRADLDGEGRGDEEIVVHTLSGFWSGQGIGHFPIDVSPV